jgi:AraC-like DNA-binding protein
MSKKRHTTADEPHFLVRTLAAVHRDGQVIAPHAHPWGQLIYAASGVLSVWTEQGSWVAPPHWAVWAPRGIAHAMRFTGAASMRTLYVRPDLAGQPAHSVVIAVSPLLRELIARAIEIGMLDDREPTNVAMVDLILHELRTRPTRSLDLPMPQSARLRRVADRIGARPDERSGHAALARRFGIGVRTLERGFVEETGLSLGAWRRQARLLHALRRLGEGASVKQAAAEVGYQSASAFIAAFRGVLDTTPGRYFSSSASRSQLPSVAALA